MADEPAPLTAGEVAELRALLAARATVGPAPAAIPATGGVPDVVTDTVVASDWGNSVGSSSRGRAVSRFASKADRTAAIAAPVEGMVAHTGDDHRLAVVAGSGAWSSVRSRLYSADLGTADLVCPANATTTLHDWTYTDIDGPVEGCYEVAVALQVKAPVAGGAFDVSINQIGSAYPLRRFASGSAAVNYTGFVMAGLLDPYGPWPAHVRVTLNAWGGQAITVRANYSVYVRYWAMWQPVNTVQTLPGPIEGQLPPPEVIVADGLGYDPAAGRGHPGDDLEAVAR